MILCTYLEYGSRRCRAGTKPIACRLLPFLAPRRQHPRGTSLNQNVALFHITTAVLKSCGHLSLRSRDTTILGASVTIGFRLNSTTLVARLVVERRTFCALNTPPSRSVGCELLRAPEGSGFLTVPEFGQHQCFPGLFPCLSSCSWTSTVRSRVRSAFWWLWTDRLRLDSKAVYILATVGDRGAAN